MGNVVLGYVGRAHSFGVTGGDSRSGQSGRFGQSMPGPSENSPASGDGSGAQSGT
jgi:hypothetical protein